MFEESPKPLGVIFSMMLEEFQWAELRVIHTNCVCMKYSYTHAEKGNSVSCHNERIKNALFFEPT